FCFLFEWHSWELSFHCFYCQIECWSYCWLEVLVEGPPGRLEFVEHLFVVRAGPGLGFLVESSLCEVGEVFVDVVVPALPGLERDFEGRSTKCFANISVFLPFPLKKLARPRQWTRNVRSA